MSYGNHRTGTLTPGALYWYKRTAGLSARADASLISSIANDRNAQISGLPISCHAVKRLAPCPAPCALAGLAGATGGVSMQISSRYGNLVWKYQTLRFALKTNSDHVLRANAITLCRIWWLNRRALRTRQSHMANCKNSRHVYGPMSKYRRRAVRI